MAEGHTGYERRDASVRPLLVFLGGLFVFMAVVFVLMVGLFKVFEVQVREASLPPSPLADQRRLPPLPRLETTPAQDRAVLDEEMETLLTAYGWTDRGTVRIPVEQAMKLVVDEGLPTRVSSRPGGSERE